MTDKPRLIERAFPLKQSWLDSVHEKNVRQGHISTLHIWPARRPLAACRPTLIATLQPAIPGMERHESQHERSGSALLRMTGKKKRLREGGVGPTMRSSAGFNKTLSGTRRRKSRGIFEGVFG